MESYRYQIKSKDEYMNFIGFLADEGINFSSSFHHDGDMTDNRYFVTVYFNDNDTEQKAKNADYLGKFHLAVENAEKMMGKYADAQAAIDDLYVDTESLRLMLAGLLNTQRDLNAVSAAESEKSQKEIERLTEEVKSLEDDRKYYMNKYLKTSKENEKIKEQTQAFCVLMNSLFPKED